MAELAALGLATNIVQFIDFGITLFQDGKELYESAEGGSAQRLELETVTSDLNDIAQELQRGALQIIKGDAELRKLASGCRKLAEQLLSILKKLKVGDGQNRKWASFKQAVKGMVKDGNIKIIDTRLHKYREQLGTRLLYLLNDQNSTLLRILQDLQGENRRLSANTVQKLDEIKETLLGDITQTLLQKNDAGSSQMILMVKHLNALADESEVVRKQQKVLRSLWFQDLKSRPENIKEAHAKTFGWIFESEESNFSEWLQSGEGIYWVQGKAGSGKSTLMKYLHGHQETKVLLGGWANGSKTVIGSHFFWNAGNSMQKSQNGLLRTLLYQVFRQCPEMIQHACEHRWKGVDILDSEPWNRDELLDIFNEPSQNKMIPAKFCFFVDGLDEFSGRAHDGNIQEITHEQREHHELVGLLDRLSTTESFKFCVSSRPWNIFQDAYGGRLNKLKLEDLTKDDIRNVVRFDLEQNPKFKRLQCQDSDRHSVVQDIVTRAQGVFLWVDLVVRSLLRGLIEGDKINGLKDRLNSFPSDLEKFFKHMIETIDPHYREDTVRFFDTAVNALQPLSVLAFQFLEDEKLEREYAIRAPIEPFKVPRIHDIHDSMETCLNARCRDLLEVTGPKNFKPFEDISIMRYKVDFLHRTVRDFFLKTKPLEQMRDPKSDFDVQLSLCRIMVGLSKALPTEKDMKTILNHIFSFSDELMFHARNVKLHGVEVGQEARLATELKLLDELDRVNKEHTKSLPMHWSNLRDVPENGIYNEYTNKTYLAMAIQAQLTKYVSRKLDPQQIKRKQGRPLLDYALRPHMITPIELPDNDARPRERLKRWHNSLIRSGELTRAS